jgi:hypothetical protein
MKSLSQDSRYLDWNSEGEPNEYKMDALSFEPTCSFLFVLMFICIVTYRPISWKSFPRFSIFFFRADR